MHRGHRGANLSDEWTVKNPKALQDLEESSKFLTRFAIHDSLGSETFHHFFPLIVSRCTKKMVDVSKLAGGMRIDQGLTVSWDLFVNVMGV